MNRIFMTLIALTVIGQLWAIPDIDVDLSTVKANSLASPLGGHDVSEIRQAFKKGLSEYLLASDGVQIRFYPSQPEDIVLGRFGLLEISFQNSAFQGLEGLNIDRGKLRVEDLRFDVSHLMSTGKLQVRTVGKVEFVLRLNENDINEYLESNQRRINLRAPRVQLTEDRMLFSGRIRNRFFSARVRTEGKFVVNQKDRTVDFQTNNVRLNALKIPGFVTGSVVNRINPILNLNKFRLMELIPIKLQEIDLGDGYVEFKGV